MFYRVPFLRFTVCLIAGIIFFEYFLATHYDLRLLLIACLLAIAVFLFGCFYVVSSKESRFFRGVVFLGFFLLGALTALVHQLAFQEQVKELKNVPYDSYVAVISSLPEKREKSYRIECVVVKIRKSTSDDWQETSIKALVNVPIKAISIPQAGTIVLVKGNLQEPKPPGNPEEFDYRLFLKRKGIAWTAYWPQKSYQVIGVTDQKWNPLQWSWAVSGWASSVLRRAISEDDSYGLIRAMILGRRDDLRGDLIDNYVASGTVHVLSVSGLHVGVFFTIISWMLGWLKRFKGGRYINFLALAVLLVFYGLITGMPPCVQRAIIMCLTWAFADVLVKDQDGVNTLSFSAFVILVFDPYALMDVGFQLSYLAILGIVLFYKPIEGLFYFGNRIAKYVWQVSALSLAAQITTFPLSIYYFHQFPSYFLLVNPLVIALTTLLLPVTMFFLVLSFLPFPEVVGIIGKGVEGIAWLTNRSVTIPKLLPGYLMEGLYINGFEMVLLFAVLLVTWAAFYYRKLVLINYLTLLALGFCSYSIYNSFTIYNDRRLVVHQIQKHFVVSLKVADKAFLITSDGFLQDSGTFNYKIKNYFISQGIAKSETFYLGNADRILYQHLKIVPDCNGRTIYLGTKKFWIGDYISKPDSVDYCLVTNKKYPSENSLLPNRSTVFLLSGTIGKRSRERWQVLLAENGNKFYDLEQNDALSVSW